MYKTLIAVAGAAIAFTATPTLARPHHATGYRVGYAFGPRYAYSDYSTLPQPLVTRYHLRNNYRYVNANGNVYVVNPRTYRVTRVIRAPM